MKIIDHTEKIMVFGGPYSNYNATISVLNEARILKIKPSNIICTGDVTAYCARPEETSDLIRQSSIKVIQGNCDENLGNNIDNCGCGFDRETICSKLSKKWYDFSVQNINYDHKKWMKDPPKTLNFEFVGKKFLVTHGSYSSINEFVFPSTSSDFKRREIEKAKADIVICGHSGIHFTEILDNEKVWHNAGVIGMPANDGTPRTWYSIISSDGDKIIFDHKALDYNFEEEADYMFRAGLNEYGQCLKIGLWPSIDILPEQEKQKTSIPLTEHRVIF